MLDIEQSHQKCYYDFTEKISNTKKEFLSISLKIRDYFTKNRFDVLVVSGMDFVDGVRKASEEASTVN